MRMAEKPTATVRRIVTTIQIDELTSVQYWNSTQMALISVGIESKFPYTKLYLALLSANLFSSMRCHSDLAHPIANPIAGSKRNSAWRTKLPVTGKRAVTSPKANCTQHTISPTMAYPRSAPRGPPVWIEPPSPRKRPVPWSCVSRTVDCSFRKHLGLQ